MLDKYISSIHGVTLAGGEGRRLRPFTDSKPKALLPVGIERKSMLEFTIKPWIKLGIGKYVFCTGYMSELVERHFGDGSKLTGIITSIFLNSDCRIPNTVVPVALLCKACWKLFDLI